MSKEVDIFGPAPKKEADIFGPAPKKLNKGTAANKVKADNNPYTPFGQSKVLVFIEEYLKDFCGARAARVAGYARDSANVTAAQILANPNAKKEVARRKAELMKKKQITTEEIVQLIKDMAIMDPIEMFEKKGNRYVVRDLDNVPKAIRMQISGMKEVYDPVSKTHLFHVTFAKKEKALEMLGKYKKMFVERFDITGNIGFSDIANKVPDRLGK